MLVDSREGKGGREIGRETSMQERNTYQLFYILPNGTKPPTQACALTRDQTHDLSVYGTTLQPTEPHGPVLKFLF